MSKLEKRILLIFGMIVLAVAAAVLIRWGGERDVIVNDFIPPSFDSAAVSGFPEGVDKTIYGTLILADGIAVSLYSAPTVTDGAAQVYFASNEINTAWVRLRLLDAQGALLGETGLLRPGEYVESLILQTQPKSAQVTAKILTYEPDTYYSKGTATAQLTLRFAD
ncbi:MAG: hypothetical protein E7445_06705 [Ruminococcaceae bacterium]|nr:hypothetical protein [Oscillospiraceae bacterium]